VPKINTNKVKTTKTKRLWKKTRATRKHVLQALAVASTAACSVGVANATVSYQIGNGGLGTFNGSIDGGTPYAETFNNALAGGIQITEVGAPVSGLPGSYITVCTDLEGTLYLGQTYTYNAPTAFSASSPSTGLDPTWGAVNTPGYLANNSVNTANAGQAIQNAAYIFYNFGGGGGTLSGSGGISGSVDQLEALQLAIWVALYDTTAGGSANLANGRFKFSGVDAAVANDVAQYTAGLTGNYGYTGDLFQPNPDNQYGDVPQELLYNVVPGGTPLGGPVVPESPTVIAGALLLVPLAASMFKVLRRKQAA